MDVGHGDRQPPPHPSRADLGGEEVSTLAGRSARSRVPRLPPEAAILGCSKPLRSKFSRVFARSIPGPQTANLVRVHAAGHRGPVARASAGLWPRRSRAPGPSHRRRRGTYPRRTGQIPDGRSDGGKEATTKASAIRGCSAECPAFPTAQQERAARGTFPLLRHPGAPPAAAPLDGWQAAVRAADGRRVRH